jgi:hypothetical protein
VFGRNHSVAENMLSEEEKAAIKTKYQSFFDLCAESITEEADKEETEAEIRAEQEKRADPIAGIDLGDLLVNMGKRIIVIEEVMMEATEKLQSTIADLMSRLKKLEDESSKIKL